MLRWACAAGDYAAETQSAWGDADGWRGGGSDNEDVTNKVNRYVANLHAGIGTRVAGQAGVHNKDGACAVGGNNVPGVVNIDSD